MAEFSRTHRPHPLNPPSPRTKFAETVTAVGGEGEE